MAGLLIKKEGFMNAPAYAINLFDGRIILCTKESENNVDYVRISKKTVSGIKDKKFSVKDVVDQINKKRQLSMTMDNWSEYVEKRNHMNVRVTPLNLTDLEGIQTDVDEDPNAFDFESEKNAEDQEIKRYMIDKHKVEIHDPKPVEDEGEDFEPPKPAKNNEQDHPKSPKNKGGKGKDNEDLADKLNLNL